MRIACIDKTAQARLELEAHINQCFQACRETIGHLPPVTTLPSSKEEVLLGSEPGLVVLGPGLSMDEAFSTARNIKECFDSVQIFIVIKPEFYTLRHLKRFEKLASECFSLTDPPTRLVHKITTLRASATKKRQGKVVAALSTKGGVGTSSIVAGLGHAAQALDKKAILLDLSSNASLVQYLNPARWHSIDYATALNENRYPEAQMLSRCIITAPNGLDILLPPSGGSEVRERWLRDPERFELSLCMLDLLQDEYDIIFVDVGTVEGILPFAITMRSDATLYVTSNDPASVYILAQKISEIMHATESPTIHLLLNKLCEFGLSERDTFEFIEEEIAQSDSLHILPALNRDTRAGAWIGTANSIYTEGARSTRDTLQRAVRNLLGEADNNRDLERPTSTGRKLLSHRLSLPLPKKKKEENGTHANVAYPNFQKAQPGSHTHAEDEFTDSLSYESPREVHSTERGV